MGIKTGEHPKRYVVDSGQDVILIAHFPDRLISFKDLTDRFYTIEKITIPVANNMLKQMSIAAMEAAIDFNEGATEAPFTDIDALITALTAARNERATAEGVATVGTYTVV